ncbi:MAG: RNA polymerase subunit sigma-70 [Solirubrobacteraceae bacterium]
MTTPATDLTAAAEGDETAFARLVAPHRAGLLAHCYRMLGSTQDAEDALQDALLRAWRGLARFEGRSSLRSWLYSIATNVCLRALERRGRRFLPQDGAPAGEVRWLEPFPDAELRDERPTPEARYEERESVELAFVAALQHLSPRQRAVLVLRDVLGFAPAEIATSLDASPAAVYSALQRAHATVEERAPERSQQATLRALGDQRLREIVERYVAAWESADVAGLMSLLTDDAAFAMPPLPQWYRGREAIERFLRVGPFIRPRWRLEPAHLNGQLSFAYFEQDGTPHAVDVVDLAPDGRIAAITAFLPG